MPFIEYVLVHLKMNLVIFGYRGYGKSQGTPTEQGVYLDGLAMANYVFEDQEAEKYIDRDQVFLFGRSLGGAIAAKVALDDSLPFKGIIIENTFTTMGDLVDVMFPFLRYFRKYLLKSKFETINIIGEIKKPILFCRSELDELIPQIQMVTLYNSTKGALFKQFYTINEGTHNDGFRTDIIGYANAIQKFVEECNRYYNNQKINKKKEKENEKNLNKEYFCTNDNNKPKLD